MCAFSNISDWAKDNWTIPSIPTMDPNPKNPIVQPWQQPTVAAPAWNTPYNGPTKEQFQELIELLRAAKKFDKATGQPDCEDAMKKEMLRKMAQSVGIDLPADL